MAARKTKSTKKASTSKHTKLTPRSRKRSAKPTTASSAKREVTKAFQRVRGLVEGAFAEALAKADSARNAAKDAVSTSIARTKNWLLPTRA